MRTAVISALALLALPSCGGDDDVVLLDAATDAPTSDASASDASPFDASPPDATLDAPTADAPADAPPSDGGECRLELIDSRPEGSPVGLGELCDDVFVCAADAADLARLRAVAPELECEPGTTFDECDAIVCVLRTSTIDEDELRTLCALTALEPPPAMLCQIYL